MVESIRGARRDIGSKSKGATISQKSAKSVGENVAYGFSSATSVVTAWIKSDEHRAIIEKESYTHFGISTEQNIEGRYFFTQIFIKQ